MLESQDQELVDDVNASMREDAASGRSSEKYDYKFDSSFEGDLDYTGLGGSVDASLNFQGSSTDVRDSASKAAINAVQKQVSRTERTRRQSTRVVTGTEATQDQFESTFTQTVRNPTDHSITIALFQLVQEYVALTVLTDVSLAFSNGGQVDMVHSSGLTDCSHGVLSMRLRPSSSKRRFWRSCGTWWTAAAALLPFSRR